ncbi:hypothetical protein [Streptomyces subrutilus]|uniref:hypothetical protein n=1 Tax=Streptomyces subrutilus TaxID=36818 RepID=UPI00340EAA63
MSAAGHTAPEESEARPTLEHVRKSGAMAAIVADLRTYLPTRDQIAIPFAGVGAGTRVLIGNGWTWLSRDGWIWDGLSKAGAVAGGVVFGFPAAWQAIAAMTGPYAPFVPTAGFICACAAAKRYAPAEDRSNPKPTAQTAEGPKAEPAAVEHRDDEPDYLDEGDGEPIEVGEVAAVIRDVAARHQHQGAHLEDLLTEPLFQGWEKAALKAAMTDDWGLPVESFKLIFPTLAGKRQRNREGVRLRHLPPTPARWVGEEPVQGLSPAPSQPPAQGPANIAGWDGSRGGQRPLPDSARAPSQGVG